MAAWSDLGPATTLAISLGIGLTVLAAAAAWLEWWVRESATLRRTIWRIVVAGGLLLLAAEATGAGHALRAFSYRLTDFCLLPAASRSASDDDRPPADSSRRHVTGDNTDTSESTLSIPERELPLEVADRTREPQPRDFREEWMREPLAAVFARRSGSQAEGLLLPVRGEEAAVPRPLEDEATSHGPSNEHRFQARAPSLDSAAEAWWSPAARYRLVRGLGLLWLIGGAALFLRMLMGRLLLWRIAATSATIQDARLITLLDDVARRLGGPRTVRLLESSRWSAPVAFGCWRSTIVVPKSFAAEFSEEQQRAVLAHEMGHLSGRDPVWQLAAELLTAVLWWHPAAWWIQQQLRATSENAADEASLLVPDGPAALAASLVAMGRKLAPAGPVGALSAGGGGFRSSLGRRVDRLLQLAAEPVPSRSWSAPIAVGLGAVLLLLTISLSAGARPRPTFDPEGTTMSVMRVSWRQSLAASALLALGGVAAPAPAQEPKDSDADVLAAVADEDREEVEKEKDKGEADEAREKKEGEGEKRERNERVRKERRPEVAEKRERDERKRDGEERRERKGERDEERIRRDLQRGKEERIRRRIGEVRVEARKRAEAHAQIVRELAELQRKLSEPGIKKEQAEEIREKMNHLRKKQQDLAQSFSLEARARQEKMRAIYRKVQELLKEGKREEAEKLIREARGDIAGPFARREARGLTLREWDNRPRPEIDEKRAKHLRAAAENLRAAGLNAEAARILRMLHGHNHAEGRPDHAGHRPDEHRAPGAPDPLGDVRAQIRQLTRQLAEMREMIQRLHGGRDRRDGDRFRGPPRGRERDEPRPDARRRPRREGEPDARREREPRADERRRDEPRRDEPRRDKPRRDEPRREREEPKPDRDR